jgi:hypothetical protein
MTPMVINAEWLGNPVEILLNINTNISQEFLRNLLELVVDRQLDFMMPSVLKSAQKQPVSPLVRQIKTLDPAQSLLVTP